MNRKLLQFLCKQIHVTTLHVRRTLRNYKTYGRHSNALRSHNNTVLTPNPTILIFIVSFVICQSWLERIDSKIKFQLKSVVFYNVIVQSVHVLECPVFGLSIQLRCTIVALLSLWCWRNGKGLHRCWFTFGPFEYIQTECIWRSR